MKFASAETGRIGWSPARFCYEPLLSPFSSVRKIQVVPGLESSFPPSPSAALGYGLNLATALPRARVQVGLVTDPAAPGNAISYKLRVELKMYDEAA